MPTYTFRNIYTNKIYDEIMPYSAISNYLNDHPDVLRYYGPGTAPSIGDAMRMGIRRIDNGFRDVLTNIAEKTPGGQGLKDRIR